MAATAASARAAERDFAAQYLRELARSPRVRQPDWRGTTPALTASTTTASNGTADKCESQHDAQSS